MFKIIGISLILAVIQISDSAPAYQFLPPRDGYVPVYIRLGDTPLDEINPDLALAFHESKIETRNVIDLEEQMQNDGPNNDDFLESLEEVKDKSSIAIDSNSEEEPKPKTPVKSFDDELDSEEKQPEKKIPVSDNKSEEGSEEDITLSELTKANDSEEIVKPSSTINKPTKPDDSSVEEPSDKKNVAAPAKQDNSSEELNSKFTEKRPSASNESKSSEEV